MFYLTVILISITILIVFLLSTSSTQTQTIKNELQVSPILPSTIIEEILDEAELNTQNIQIPTVSIKKTTNDDISDSIEKTTFDIFLMLL